MNAVSNCIAGTNRIVVGRAVTEASRSAALALRFRGYRRYFSDQDDVEEPLDSREGVWVFLARDAIDSTPLGTLRVVLPPATPESDSYLNLASLFSPEDWPIAEATRFSVPPSAQAEETKLLLLKAFYLLARDAGAATMLIWARRGAQRLYSRFLFEDRGEAGKFRHPILGNREHRTMTLPVAEAAGRFARHGHPLHDFFVRQEHPNIRL